jgi:hypothetical protein
MNVVRTLLNIGDVYDKVVVEGKHYTFAPKGTFKTATDKKPVEAKADPKAFTPKKSGPENADGFKKDLIDPEKAKVDNFYEPKKFSQNLEKTEVQTINTFMSKSIFDKLYEDVMSGQPEDVEANDAEALGLPSGDAGEDVGGEEVTFTLPRDVAQKLHDVIMAALESGVEETGGEEGAGEDEGSAGEDELTAPSEQNEEKKDKDEDEEEDNQEVAKEGTEMKELPTSAGQSLQKKDNKVGDTTNSLKTSGAGDSKVTDKVGNDGEKGHALVGSGIKGGAATSPKGKANVVNSKTSKVGAYLAGLK